MRGESTAVGLSKIRRSPRVERLWGKAGTIVRDWTNAEPGEREAAVRRLLEAETATDLAVVAILVGHSYGCLWSLNQEDEDIMALVEHLVAWGEEPQ